MTLLEKILAARGLDKTSAADFLSPDYSKKHDPFLLPDMAKAVARLETAHKNQEKITIYGDYDIDGLTATALLLDSFGSFGFKNIDAFIPNRFVEGYGLTVDAMETIAATGATLIITVDCGSLSHKEIDRAKELGVDVIVTDHHSVSDKYPNAVAVINPKRTDHSYPFIDLAGVGVAFKLVQALQIQFNKQQKTHSTRRARSGLAFGQEKWLLDLVALGTVCDVVSLTGENRTNVYWGLRVLKKTRRPGLRALMAVARVEVDKLNARTLGFVLGPRMNAAGRLETAQYALDMLKTDDSAKALELAQVLDEMNHKRRKDQDKIMEEAVVVADKYADEPVLVVSSKGWSHGIIGIVAAKLLEKYKKPTFVLEEMGDESKGSARSYGDFSAVDAINYAKDVLIKGGGHKLAAGVTVKTSNIDAFRQKVNEFYRSLNIVNQELLLLQKEDAEAELGEVTGELLEQLSKLEPFGNGNPEPVLKSTGLAVGNVRKMGDKGQHLKLSLKDNSGFKIDMVSFNAPKEFFVEIGETIDIWYQPTLNEWRGRIKVEGWLKNIQMTEA